MPTAEAVVGDQWRDLIERFLPWYSPSVEAKRDRHTEAIRRRSIATRKRSERIIAEYRAAEKVSAAAGEALIKEARRDES
jgi:hypothetical protein